MSELVLSDGFNVSRTEKDRIDIKGVERIRIVNHPSSRSIFIIITFSFDISNIKAELFECLSSLISSEFVDDNVSSNIVLRIDNYADTSFQFNKFVDGIIDQLGTKLELCINQYKEIVSEGNRKRRKRKRKEKQEDIEMETYGDE